MRIDKMEDDYFYDEENTPPSTPFFLKKEGR